MSIKHAILGLLSWKPSTGYELKKIFEESTSMYWSGNNNQIYKALVALLDEGLVTYETEHQDKLPSKKTYTVTVEGISELKAWLLSPAEAPEFKKPFLVQLAWSGLLSDEELSGMLGAYESEINVQILLQQEKMRRGITSPGRTPREVYLWNMIEENFLSSYRNELEWIQKVKEELFKGR